MLAKQNTSAPVAQPGTGGSGGAPPFDDLPGFGGGDDQPWRPPRLHLYSVGIAVGLVSVSSFFAALLLVFFLVIRRQPAAHPYAAPWMLWSSTALLCASSFELERTRYALRRGVLRRAARRLRATLALGGAFLLSQVSCWWSLAAQGVYLRANPRGSAFYVLTAAHGLHLAGGLVWLGVLLRRSGGLIGSEQDLRRHRASATAASIFWHFMGALWLVLFAFLLAWSREVLPG